MANNKEHITEKYVTGKGELTGFIALTKPSTKFNKPLYCIVESAIVVFLPNRLIFFSECIVLLFLTLRLSALSVV